MNLLKTYQVVGNYVRVVFRVFLQNEFLENKTFDSELLI